MKFVAIARSVRISPRKIRLVADGVRKLSIDNAFRFLMLANKRAAGPLEKTLKSAIANAINNGKVKREDLLIESIDVVEGQALKRYHPSSRGRVHPYKKKTSHITVVLKDKGGKTSV